MIDVSKLTPDERRRVHRALLGGLDAKLNAALSAGGRLVLGPRGSLMVVGPPAAASRRRGPNRRAQAVRECCAACKATSPVTAQRAAWAMRRARALQRAEPVETWTAGDWQVRRHRAMTRAEAEAAIVASARAEVEAVRARAAKSPTAAVRHPDMYADLRYLDWAKRNGVEDLTQPTTRSTR